MALSYLCKLAEGTLNVPSANLHNRFWAAGSSSCAGSQFVKPPSKLLIPHIVGSVIGHSSALHNNLIGLTACSANDSW